MTPPDRLVVVGASLAGLRAVETARAAGFRGALTLVGAEDHLPYDRPPLSKEFLAAGEPAPAPHFPGVDELRSVLDVDVRLGAPARDLDLHGHTVGVGDDTLDWDALIVATGSTARALPGTAHLAGVHVLRTLDDALAVRAALDAGARTVVVGAGFIGAEIAAAARARDLPATVVEVQPTPLARAVGETAGRALGGLHARHGTDLRCGVGVDHLEGADRVTGVRLGDGALLPADLVVVGIGASPTTAWLEGSGLTLDDGVVCDTTLAAAPGVWAAGDVARWASPDLGRSLRVEHWTTAVDMGVHAASNAVDPAAATPFRHVPYFWSDWYGRRIQFAGVPVGEPEVVYGSWDADAFTALYRDGDRLAGVLTLDRRGDVMKYRAQIGKGRSYADALAFAATRVPVGA